MSKIVTLTLNPTIDKNTSAAVVIDDIKLRCKNPTYKPGGGGINVSRAIHNLGGESVAYYAAGGLTGKILEHFLNAAGVTHHPIWIKEWTRENLTVIEETTNKQFRFTMPGPAFQPAESKLCFDTVMSIDPAPEYLIASGSLPNGVSDDFYAELARAAKQKKIKIIVDTSGEALVRAAREGVFLLKPNLNELSILVGRPLADEIEQDKAARELIAKGACVVLVLSLGSDGVLFATREGTKRFGAPAVTVKSRIGAGDSVVAGIVLGLVNGMPLEDAVRYGVAAGSATVMMPASELGRREDTERLFREMKASGK